ncbi:MAG: FixH family protein [Acidimicrobiales bacterium]
MRWCWRLGVVAALALASFVPALSRFSAAAAKSCAQRVHADTSYAVQWDQPPRTDVSSYRLHITRTGGQAVTGAHVCINSYMLGMSAMAVTDTGREVAPGTYEMRLTFEMGSKWAGQVIVTVPGKDPVAIPLSLDVTDAWGMSPAS